MLLILTGDIQTGKTRWLASCVGRLEHSGVACHGVLAPGVWRACDDGTFDKLGIDNELLPGHEMVRFARRADLARAEGSFDPTSQAARAQLRWHISDEAIGRVNAHFEELVCLSSHATSDAARGGADGSVTLAAAGGPERALLVVDELGQLELLRDGGLTGAVRMLERGPRGLYAHAVVVVRDRFGLVERAEERLADAWGGSVRIGPTEESWRRWLAPLAVR